LIVLLGLAGFLVGLVGMVGSAILKASEAQEELNIVGTAENCGFLATCFAGLKPLLSAWKPFGLAN